MHQRDNASDTFATLRATMRTTVSGEGTDTAVPPSLSLLIEDQPSFTQDMSTYIIGVVSNTSDAANLGEKQSILGEDDFSTTAMPSTQSSEQSQYTVPSIITNSLLIPYYSGYVKNSTVGVGGHVYLPSLSGSIALCAEIIEECSIDAASRRIDLGELGAFVGSVFGSITEGEGNARGKASTMSHDEVKIRYENLFGLVGLILISLGGKKERKVVFVGGREGGREVTFSDVVLGDSFGDGVVGVEPADEEVVVRGSNGNGGDHGGTEDYEEEKDSYEDFLKNWKASISPKPPHQSQPQQDTSIEPSRQIMDEILNMTNPIHINSSPFSSPSPPPTQNMDSSMTRKLNRRGRRLLRWLHVIGHAVIGRVQPSSLGERGARSGWNFAAIDAQNEDEFAKVGEDVDWFCGEQLGGALMGGGGACFAGNGDDDGGVGEDEDNDSDWSDGGGDLRMGPSPGCSPIKPEGEEFLTITPIGKSAEKAPKSMEDHRRKIDSEHVKKLAECMFEGIVGRRVGRGSRRKNKKAIDKAATAATIATVPPSAGDSSGRLHSGQGTKFNVFPHQISSSASSIHEYPSWDSDHLSMEPAFGSAIPTAATTASDATRPFVNSSPSRRIGPRPLRQFLCSPPSTSSRSSVGSNVSNTDGNKYSRSKGKSDGRSSGRRHHRRRRPFEENFLDGSLDIDQVKNVGNYLCRTSSGKEDCDIGARGGGVGRESSDEGEEEEDEYEGDEPTAKHSEEKKDEAPPPPSDGTTNNKIANPITLSIFPQNEIDGGIRIETNPTASTAALTSTASTTATATSMTSSKAKIVSFATSRSLTPSLHNVAPLSTHHTSPLHRVVPVLTCSCCGFVEFPGCSKCGGLLGCEFNSPLPTLQQQQQKRQHQDQPTPQPLTHPTNTISDTHSPSRVTGSILDLRHRSTDDNVVADLAAMMNSHRHDNPALAFIENAYRFMGESSPLPPQPAVGSRLPALRTTSPHSSRRHQTNDQLSSATPREQVLDQATTSTSAVATTSPLATVTTSARHARCPSCLVVSTLHTLPWSDGCRVCKVKDSVDTEWWALTVSEAEYLVRGFPRSGRGSRNENSKGEEKVKDAWATGSRRRNPTSPTQHQYGQQHQRQRQHLSSASHAPKIPMLRCSLCRSVGFIGGKSSRTGLMTVGLPKGFKRGTTRDGNCEDEGLLSAWKSRLKHIENCPGSSLGSSGVDVEFFEKEISWEEAKFLYKALSSEGGVEGVGGKKNFVSASYESRSEGKVKEGMVVVGMEDGSKSYDTQSFDGGVETKGKKKVFGTVASLPSVSPRQNRAECSGLLIDTIPDLTTGIVVPALVGRKRDTSGQIAGGQGNGNQSGSGRGKNKENGEGSVSSAAAIARVTLTTSPPPPPTQDLDRQLNSPHPSSTSGSRAFYPSNSTPPLPPHSISTASIDSISKVDNFRDFDQLALVEPDVYLRRAPNEYPQAYVLTGIGGVGLLPSSSKEILDDAKGYSNDKLIVNNFQQTMLESSCYHPLVSHSLRSICESVLSTSNRGVGVGIGATSVGKNDGETGGSGVSLTSGIAKGLTTRDILKFIKIEYVNSVRRRVSRVSDVGTSNELQTLDITGGRTSQNRRSSRRRATTRQQNEGVENVDDAIRRSLRFPGMSRNGSSRASRRLLLNGSVGNLRRRRVSGGTRGAADDSGTVNNNTATEPSSDRSENLHQDDDISSRLPLLEPRSTFTPSSLRATTTTTNRSDGNNSTSNNINSTPPSLSWTVWDKSSEESGRNSGRMILRNLLRGTESGLKEVLDTLLKDMEACCGGGVRTRSRLTTTTARAAMDTLLPTNNAHTNGSTVTPKPRVVTRESLHPLALHCRPSLGEKGRSFGESIIFQPFFSTTIATGENKERKGLLVRVDGMTDLPPARQSRNMSANRNPKLSFSRSRDSTPFLVISADELSKEAANSLPEDNDKEKQGITVFLPDAEEIFYWYEEGGGGEEKEDDDDSGGDDKEGKGDGGHQDSEVGSKGRVDLSAKENEDDIVIEEVIGMEEEEEALTMPTTPNGTTHESITIQQQRRRQQQQQQQHLRPWLSNLPQPQAALLLQLLLRSRSSALRSEISRHGSGYHELPFQLENTASLTHSQTLYRGRPSNITSILDDNPAVTGGRSANSTTAVEETRFEDCSDSDCDETKDGSEDEYSSDDGKDDNKVVAAVLPTPISSLHNRIRDTSTITSSGLIRRRGANNISTGNTRSRCTVSTTSNSSTVDFSSTSNTASPSAIPDNSNETSPLTGPLYSQGRTKIDDDSLLCLLQSSGVLSEYSPSFILYLLGNGSTPKQTHGPIRRSRRRLRLFVDCKRRRAHNISTRDLHSSQNNSPTMNVVGGCDEKLFHRWRSGVLKSRREFKTLTTSSHDDTSGTSSGGGVSWWDSSDSDSDGDNCDSDFAVKKAARSLHLTFPKIGKKPPRNCSITVSCASGFPTIAPLGMRICCGVDPIGDKKFRAVYYYEVTVETAGLAQIGWVLTPDYQGDSMRGKGVGDDDVSWGYDGHRGYRWHSGGGRWGGKWKENSVVGVVAVIESVEAADGRPVTGTGGEDADEEDLFSDLDGDSSSEEEGDRTRSLGDGRDKAKTPTAKCNFAFSLNGSFASPMGTAFRDVLLPLSPFDAINSNATTMEMADLIGLRPGVTMNKSFKGSLNFGQSPFAHPPVDKYPDFRPVTSFRFGKDGPDLRTVDSNGGPMAAVKNERIDAPLAGKQDTQAHDKIDTPIAKNYWGYKFSVEEVIGAADKLDFGLITEFELLYDPNLTEDEEERAIMTGMDPKSTPPKATSTINVLNESYQQHREAAESEGGDVDDDDADNSFEGLSLSRQVGGDGDGEDRLRGERYELATEDDEFVEEHLRSLIEDLAGGASARAVNTISEGRRAVESASGDTGAGNFVYNDDDFEIVDHDADEVESGEIEASEDLDSVEEREVDKIIQEGDQYEEEEEKVSRQTPQTPNNTSLPKIWRPVSSFKSDGSRISSFGDILSTNKPSSAIGVVTTPGFPTVARPVGYKLVYFDGTRGISGWRPIPPSGFSSLGDVFVAKGGSSDDFFENLSDEEDLEVDKYEVGKASGRGSPRKNLKLEFVKSRPPALDLVVCVRTDLLKTRTESEVHSVVINNGACKLEKTSTGISTERTFRFCDDVDTGAEDLLRYFDAGEVQKSNVNGQGTTIDDGVEEDQGSEEFIPPGTDFEAAETEDKFFSSSMIYLNGPASTLTINPNLTFSTEVLRRVLPHALREEGDSFDRILKTLCCCVGAEGGGGGEVVDLLFYYLRKGGGGFLGDSSVAVNDGHPILAIGEATHRIIKLCRHYVKRVQQDYVKQILRHSDKVLINGKEVSGKVLKNQLVMNEKLSTEFLPLKMLRCIETCLLGLVFAGDGEDRATFGGVRKWYDLLKQQQLMLTNGEKRKSNGSDVDVLLDLIKSIRWLKFSYQLNKQQLREEEEDEGGGGAGNPLPLNKVTSFSSIFQPSRGGHGSDSGSKPQVPLNVVLCWVDNIAFAKNVIVVPNVFVGSADGENPKLDIYRGRVSIEGAVELTVVFDYNKTTLKKLNGSEGEKPLTIVDDSGNSVIFHSEGSLREIKKFKGSRISWSFGGYSDVDFLVKFTVFPRFQDFATKLKKIRKCRKIIRDFAMPEFTPAMDRSLVNFLNNHQKFVVGRGGGEKQVGGEESEEEEDMDIFNSGGGGGGGDGGGGGGGRSFTGHHHSMMYCEILNNIRKSPLELAWQLTRLSAGGGGKNAIEFSWCTNLTVDKLAFRIDFLMRLNRHLKGVLPLINTTNLSKGSLGRVLRELGGVVLKEVKFPRLTVALEATQQNSGGVPTLNLDNFLAAKSIENGEITVADSNCIFVQAFKFLHHKTAMLRMVWDGDRVFQVSFAGEMGSDAGGVYREGLSRIVEDLFSVGTFDLFVPCPNGVHDINLNKEKFVPNPKYKGDCNTSATAMYEFVGKMMGVSLRTNLSLPFHFSSMVWNELVMIESAIGDLFEIDSLAVNWLKKLQGTSEDDWESEGVNWECTGCAGELLRVGPAGKGVKWGDRRVFVKKVVEARMRESKSQVEAIARGFYSIVPERALALFTGAELEVLVCGVPDFDMKLWKKNTHYSGGYHENDVTIVLFWKVLECFTNEQKSALVRFAWGRSRLPPSGKWSCSMNISKRGDVAYLPSAHTCFFSIDLPPYKTEEEMRIKLTTAVAYGTVGVLNA